MPGYEPSPLPIQQPVSLFKMSLGCVMRVSSVASGAFGAANLDPPSLKRPRLCLTDTQPSTLAESRLAARIFGLQQSVRQT